MSEQKTVTLSDGMMWTKLDYPPGHWSGESNGRTYFSRAPWTITVGGFTAEDHRKIADVMDPPAIPVANQLHSPTAEREVVRAALTKLASELFGAAGDSHIRMSVECWRDREWPAMSADDADTDRRTLERMVQGGTIL